MLDEKLKEQNFRDSLLEKEKIAPLEYLLEKNSKTLELLNKQKLDYGAVRKRDELPEIFKEVKEFTDKFLDVDIEEPEYDYYSIFMNESPYNAPLKGYGLGTIILAGGIILLNPLIAAASLLPFWKARQMQKLLDRPVYDHSFKKVILKKEPETLLKPIFSHEYDHYLQYAIHCKNITPVEYTANYATFTEGHARGVARAASHHFREKYDNEAYLKRITDFDVGELKSTYQWLCLELRTKPNLNLLKTYSSRDKVEGQFRYYTFKPTIHAVGNAGLSIEEEKHGDEIYKKLLHGDTSFL